MRTMLLPLLLGLSGCIWISPEDLQSRQRDLGDVDGDGYVDLAYGGEDCDDSDEAIHPDATELCDDVDNDCDGQVDEDDADDALAWYADQDGDGHGDASDVREACTQPSGYVPDADDCDDGDASITDGEVFYTDGDGDGFGDAAAAVQSCEPRSGLVADDSDCDDSDPLVFPGAPETLGDALDANCDGDPDAVAFSAVDTRAGVEVQGPRLAVNSTRVYLGWAAEWMDLGSVVQDAVAVGIYDLAAPWEGEVDFWSRDARSELGSLGGFDLVADDSMFAVARSFTDADSRSIQLEGVDATALTFGSHVSSRDIVAPFDDLQLSLSAQGKLSVVGCGLDGAGVHGVQVSSMGLVAGSASPSFDASSNEAYDDHDTCEYDPVALDIYMGDSAEKQLDYYGFDTVRGELSSFASATVPWDIQDTEINVVNGWLVAAISDLIGGDYLYLDIQPDTGSTVIPYVWQELDHAIEQVDVSATTDGITIACGADRAGDAWLLWADLEVDEYLSRVQLEPELSSRIEDCAITVTADGLVVVALRATDELALGVARMP
jgi:hypothetical protein